MIEETVINSSNISTEFTLPRAWNATVPESTTLAMTSILAFMIVTTLFGNVLVIMAFYITPSLREVVNYCVASLAVADILIAITSIPLWIGYINNNWSNAAFGPVVFRFWVCFDIFLGMASILNLTSLTIIRYIHIVKPYFYRRHFSHRIGLVAVGTVWVMSAILSSIRIFMWYSKKPLFEFVIFFWGLFLPSIIIAFCYWEIFKVARRHMQAIRDITVPRASTVNLSSEFRIAKNIAIVIMAYLICWSPFLFLQIVDGLYPSLRPSYILVSVLKLLHYSNSSLNPIIYSVFDRNYSNAFKLILRRMKYRLCWSSRRRGSSFLSIDHPKAERKQNGTLISTSYVEESAVQSIELQRPSMEMNKMMDEDSQ